MDFYPFYESFIPFKEIGEEFLVYVLIGIFLYFFFISSNKMIV